MLNSTIASYFISGTKIHLCILASADYTIPPWHTQAAWMTDQVVISPDHKCIRKSSHWTIQIMEDRSLVTIKAVGAKPLPWRAKKYLKISLMGKMQGNKLGEIQKRKLVLGHSPHTEKPFWRSKFTEELINHSVHGTRIETMVAVNVCWFHSMQWRTNVLTHACNTFTQ